ncbi:calpain-2 catalytic subunit-like [Oncorhynchus keta]|uniref:calpain-2 catalytic subunit-like n=1 Tax=Oncorhynchus keta TaxID=8018 RepID=UPI00227B2433|nr:calpain-2 catalytic subunit-like [Oncorhynchus keta]
MCLCFLPAPQSGTMSVMKTGLINKSENGEFWMSFSDFLSQYSRLEICNLTPDTLSEDENQNWALNKFEGAWRERLHSRGYGP